MDTRYTPLVCKQRKTTVLRRNPRKTGLIPVKYLAAAAQTPRTVKALFQLRALTTAMGLQGDRA